MILFQQSFLQRSFYYIDPFYSDPFYGPNYLLHHVWIQAVLIIGVSQVFSMIFTKWVLLKKLAKAANICISKQFAQLSVCPLVSQIPLNNFLQTFFKTKTGVKRKCTEHFNAAEQANSAINLTDQ